MKRLPPYVIFALCGVLFLSMGMVIITADGEFTTPATEMPPVDSTLLPTDVPPLDVVAPPADAAAEQPTAPPADVVVQPPPTTEVLPVEPAPVDPLPTLEGGPIAESFPAAGQPTPLVPAAQPTAVIVPPSDLQATVVPAVVVVPATLVPSASQALGTLPPPSNYIPPTIVALTAQVYGQIIVPLRTDFTGVVVTLTLPDSSVVQTITDSRGVFNFASLPAGVFRVSAGITGYLSSQFDFGLAEGQALTLPPATLIGGDTNLDNRIDLSDAVLIAANFNITASSPADLNQDGVVDIRDLTAIGAYFGQAGPVAWQ